MFRARTGWVIPVGQLVTVDFSPKASASDRTDVIVR